MEHTPQTPNCPVCGCAMPLPDLEHPYWTVTECDCTGAGSGCCGGSDERYRYCATDEEREQEWMEERVEIGSRWDCQIGCSCVACEPHRQA